MPTVSVVYSPDPDLGPDPLDETAKAPRRLAELIEPGSDMLLIWREWGEQFPGGSRTHVVGDGIWQNVTVDQLRDAIEALAEL